MSSADGWTWSGVEAIRRKRQESAEQIVLVMWTTNCGIPETQCAGIEPVWNDVQASLPRTPSRTLRKSSGLHGVREAARKDSTLRFTALLHHVHFDCLYAAFFNLKKTAAVGVDEVPWHEYEQNVEASIEDLHERIHRGACRAKPSLRIHIPKPDGRTRPLGIASLEDKIVQQAVV